MTHTCVLNELTHRGRVTHICVGKLTNIGSDNGWSPGRRQTIIWTNAGILLIGPLGTNFSEILIKNLHFHSRKCMWKCRLENGVHFVSASMCKALSHRARDPSQRSAWPQRPSTPTHFCVSDTECQSLTPHWHDQLKTTMCEVAFSSEQTGIMIYIKRVQKPKIGSWPDNNTLTYMHGARAGKCMFCICAANLSYSYKSCQL